MNRIVEIPTTKNPCLVQVKSTQSIKVHTSFEGIHFYPGAPEPVKDLRNEHRHIFHVRYQITVFHTDREIEFWLLVHDVNEAIKTLYQDVTTYPNAHYLGAKSCEMIAQDIYHQLRQKYNYLNRKVVIEVTEDDNNGSVIEFETKEAYHD